MRFLHFSGGFSEKEIFNRLITRPISKGDPNAYCDSPIVDGWDLSSTEKGYEVSRANISSNYLVLKSILHKIGILPK